MTKRNISSEEISTKNVSKNLIKFNLFKKSISTIRSTKRDKSVMQKKVQELHVFKPQFEDKSMVYKNLNNKPFFRYRKFKK